MKTVEKKGPFIVVSMRRFWTAQKLDKHTAEPTIHQTLPEAMADAAARTETSWRGQYAVFECIGYCEADADQKAKFKLANEAKKAEADCVRSSVGAAENPISV
jgi:hypothetical protein